MPPHIKIIRLRRQAAKRQGKRCYYCERQMGAQPQLSCTAEHLIARSERGEHSKSNIVAACKFCNAMRHRLYPRLAVASYAAKVRMLVQQGGWHELHPAWSTLA